MAGILGNSTCSRGKSPTFIYRRFPPPGILYTAVFDCQKLLYLPLSTPNANMLPWHTLFCMAPCPTLISVSILYTYVYEVLSSFNFLVTFLPQFPLHQFIPFFCFSENEFSTSQGLFMVFPGFPHLKILPARLPSLGRLLFGGRGAGDGRLLQWQGQAVGCLG